MIKWIIKTLFKAHLEAVEKETLLEARELVESAKLAQAPVYVAYNRLDPQSDQFIYGIKPMCDNKYLISWINEKKMQCLGHMMQSMVADKNAKVINGMAQVMVLEGMLTDLETFSEKYEQLESTRIEREAIGSDD